MPFTLVITASVPFTVTASVLVVSVFVPPSLTRTPVSSTKASRVPEPCSLVITESDLLVSKALVFDEPALLELSPDAVDEELPPQPANALAIITPAANTDNNFVLVFFINIISSNNYRTSFEYGLSLVNFCKAIYLLFVKYP